MRIAIYKGKEVHAWENKEAGKDMWNIQLPSSNSGVNVHVSELVFKQS